MANPSSMDQLSAKRRWGTIAVVFLGGTALLLAGGYFSQKRHERIPGGLAPKGQCPKGISDKVIQQGIEVELEHTNSKAIAKEIACSSRHPC